MTFYVAALYVDEAGPYVGLETVDAYGESRDARLYAGPLPVVAHPPCQRWGRYWAGGPSVKVKKKLGDDGGCFAAALACVRTFGGVLEHPAYSHAWPTYGLPKPNREGGWSPPDEFGGRACHVEQGHYGHRARKATWLYAVSAAPLPELRWGASSAKAKIDMGYRSTEERRTNPKVLEEPRLTDYERRATPIPFRNILLSIAWRATPS